MSKKAQRRYHGTSRASIEGKRMAAKAAIAGAETVEEVDAAASVTWTD